MHVAYGHLIFSKYIYLPLSLLNQIRCVNEEDISVCLSWLKPVPQRVDHLSQCVRAHARKIWVLHQFSVQVSYRDIRPLLLNCNQPEFLMDCNVNVFFLIVFELVHHVTSGKNPPVACDAICFHFIAEHSH